MGSFSGCYYPSPLSIYLLYARPYRGLNHSPVFNPARSARGPLYLEQTVTRAVGKYTGGLSVSLQLGGVFTRFGRGPPLGIGSGEAARPPGRQCAVVRRVAHPVAAEPCN